MKKAVVVCSYCQSSQAEETYAAHDKGVSRPRCENCYALYCRTYGGAGRRVQLRTPWENPDYVRKTRR